MVRRLRQPLSKTDWTALDFLIELRLRGLSWASLARKHGMHPNTLRTVVDRPWPGGEKLVAAEFGLDPAVIWPTRYADKKVAA